MAFTALALDTTGKAARGQALEVRARLGWVISTRKLIVGGFYADLRQPHRVKAGLAVRRRRRRSRRARLRGDLDAGPGGADRVGQGCRQPHRRGRHRRLGHAPRRTLVRAGQRRPRRPAAEKKRYEPGETAKLQLRMPLPLGHRAGDHRARRHHGHTRGDAARRRPTIEVKIDKGWAPNVYVSDAGAARPRARGALVFALPVGLEAADRVVARVPRRGPDYQPPTAMVDLAKPAFKLGWPRCRWAWPSTSCR